MKKQLLLGLLSFASICPSIAQEVQEVRLSRILRSESKSTQVGRGWVFALATVDWLRQCVLVPGIGTLIPHLILQRGSDALNVCMNALASCEWVDTSIIESKEALGE